ncbi:hypothetical protein AB1207_13580 [Kineococcus endophyticus]|uniref:Uncharacterized protein n=1 Tax=Kineococcus endophyticus TaxID=1181883 RepID=A0ABV3P818_9ACTN
MTTHPWNVEESDDTWRRLGAVVHGPAVLARAPGIAVGLRCVFAYPDSLSVWLLARADAALIPQDLPPRSDAEAAVQSQWEALWPGRPHDPLVHVTLDHGPQRRLSWAERRDDSTLDGVRYISSASRILGLPAGGQLDFEVSWGPALAPVSTRVQLSHLQRLTDRALLLLDDPRSSPT